MTTITQNYMPNAIRTGFLRNQDDLIEKLIPRRCMVVSVGMILTGAIIPALMVFMLLPVSLPLGFVGFALVAVGGTLALVYCGEI